MFIFLKFEFFRTPTPEPFGESFRENLLINLRNQNIFEKFKINRNLQRISFKMMCNMSMLRRLCYVIGSQMNGGGGGGGRPEPPSSLILQKCLFSK